MKHKTYNEMIELLSKDISIIQAANDEYKDLERFVADTYGIWEYSIPQCQDLFFNQEGFDGIFYTNSSSKRSYIRGIFAHNTWSNVDSYEITVNITPFHDYYRKDYLVDGDANSDWKTLKQTDTLTPDVLVNLGFYKSVGVHSNHILERQFILDNIENKDQHYNITRVGDNSLSQYIFFETESSWYPACLLRNGKKYVMGCLSLNTESNINFSKIHLGGFDDYSLSMEFTSFEEGINMFNHLKSIPYVNTDYCESLGFYFSN